MGALPLGQLVADLWRVESTIGQGGMGSVYHAVHKDTGMPVALKLLLSDDPEQEKRLAREAAVLRELNHPNIVSYLTHGRTPHGQLYLVTELLEGCDLAQKIKKQHGPFTIDDALHIVEQTARAVGCAHEHEVVHRDIKPSNIFLLKGESVSVRVLDFGIARRLDQSGPLVHTQSGTVPYMAPETFRPGAIIDARADVFGLGCVLYECLTGQRAFDGESIASILRKLEVDEVPNVRLLRPDVSDGVAALLEELLAKDPSRRPPNGTAVAQRIAALREQLPSRGSVPPRTTITAQEVQLLCVLLAGPPSAINALEVPAELATLPGLSAVVKRHGGKIQSFRDFNMVTLRGGSSPKELALRAAECALAIRVERPSSRLALAMGTGEEHSGWPLGDVIDRVSVLLAQAAKAYPTGNNAPILIDEALGGLLSERFSVQPLDGAYALEGRAESKPEAAGPFVGRNLELRKLLLLWEECVQERHAMPVLLTAEPGTGKTRLYREFVRRAQERSPPFELWVAQGDPLRAAAPFGLVGQVLRGLAELDEQAPIEQRREQFLSWIVALCGPQEGPHLARCLGELLGLVFDDTNDPRFAAARRNASLMNNLLRHAWRVFVHTRCKHTPLLLVLEELHWADGASLNLIDEMLAEPPRSGLMVLGLARPNVTEVFPRLWESYERTTVRLRELKDPEADRLARFVLGDAATDTLVQMVVARAGGNAFFIEEFARHELARRARGDAATSTATLPATVLAVAQARFARLDEEQRLLLRAASVFGHEFSSEGIAELLGGRSVEVIDAALRSLSSETERVLQQRASGRGYEFRHGLLREAAYAMLTTEDRERGHCLAGTWLARNGAEPGLIAEHFELGRAPKQALPWYVRAAEASVEGGDPEAALSRASRGLACVPQEEELWRLQLVRIEALGQLGRLEEQERQVYEALQGIPKTTPWRFRLLAEAGALLSRQGNGEELVELAKELFNTPALATRTEVWAVSAARIAIQLFNSSSPELGSLLLERLLSAQRSAKNTAENAVSLYTEAWVQRAIAQQAWLHGELVFCLERNERALELFLRAGDHHRGTTSARVAVGRVRLALGQIEEGIQALELARIETERIGLRSIRAMALYNLATAYAQAERWFDALTTIRQAIEAFASQQYYRMQALGLALEATVLSKQERYEEALLRAQEAQLLSTEQNRMQTSLALLQVQTASGQFQDAQETLAQIQYECEGSDRAMDPLLLHTEAQLHDAMGRHEQAKATRKRAVLWLETQLAKLPSEAHRERFLQGNPLFGTLLEAREGTDE